MSALENPRHERFAQELAKGKSATEAYEAAGYNANRGNASTLAGNQSILKRVAEIQERASIRVEVSLATLLAEAEEARQLAMQIDQPSAAIAAIKEKGVLSGIRVEKSERRTGSLTQLTDDELADIAGAGRNGTASASEDTRTLN